SSDLSGPRISESHGDRSIRPVFLFRDTDNACAEIRSPVSFADPGINGIYICISPGLLFSERKIQQAEAGRVCPDPCGNRYFLSVDILLILTNRNDEHLDAVFNRHTLL